MDAILYVLRSGCSWRQLPVDFPPWQTVYWQFQQWEKRRVTERILEELREQVRLQEGREPQPSAGIIDSQSVKAADTVGRDSRGYDAGKKINSRKRFIVTDTLGLLVVVCVMAASWQDRDGAKTTLLGAYLATAIRHVFADSGFAGCTYPAGGGPHRHPAQGQIPALPDPPNTDAACATSLNGAPAAKGALATSNTVPNPGRAPAGTRRSRRPRRDRRQPDNECSASPPARLMWPPLVDLGPS